MCKSEQDIDTEKKKKKKDYHRIKSDTDKSSSLKSLFNCWVFFSLRRPPKKKNDILFEKKKKIHNPLYKYLPLSVYNRSHLVIKLYIIIVHAS